ncbi:hypothetical protein [Allorhizocola rhizosphaerae]|uniref:hypothetical protein n=1 Tax=Allorhizocola rhizosphaerae TaxID=1872709 RepID=UPI0013C2EBB5|nr:hypothetical protein [Allorhizocola rhizosphaerae]
MSWKRGLPLVAVASAFLVAMTATPAKAVFNPIGTEPTAPYAQPVDAAVPKRGCATTIADPKSPGSSIPAVQVIYAWHDGNGNNYATYVEKIAKIMDRIDWLLDNSTNYDQHVNFSCRTGFDTSTYNGYAQALVVPEKIEAGNLSGETGLGTIVADLAAAGYNDSPNRIYLVFEDFDGTATATEVGCTVSPCVASTDDWDSGTAGHELMHSMGAEHTYITEVPNATYGNDIMISQYNDWQWDQDFNTYYDPSELSATFYIDQYQGIGEPSPDYRKDNLADHPILTAPVCCDTGYNSDLLTAQERTIEANAPWSSPTGFSLSGAGWFQVTAPGPESGVSARYYDGRRSLTVNVQSHAEGVVSVTRKPSVTPGTRYRFFSRLTTNTSGSVKLRLSWYNSSNTPLSTNDSSTFALDSVWREYSVSAVAPAGAATVQISVVSPSGQNFAYFLDSLQLNQCTNGVTSDGCRLPHP